MSAKHSLFASRNVSIAISFYRLKILREFYIYRYMTVTYNIDHLSVCIYIKIRVRYHLGQHFSLF